MGFRVIERRDFGRLAILGLALGALLTYGFLSSSLALQRLVPLFAGWETPAVIFPLLAFLFYFPGAKQVGPFRKTGLTWSLASTLVAAFAYGLALPSRLRLEVLSPEVYLWFLVATPLGEELLFRGWLQNIFRTVSRGTFATETNPIPVSVWISAAAFSLWHVQNVGAIPLGYVLFQMFYTFFLGIWLGMLREKSGTILVPILAHSLINLSTGLAMLVPPLTW